MEFYGTLGPACASAEVLSRMLDAGMTGARLNLSHMGLSEAEPWLEALFNAGRSRGLRPELLIDTQGPELRTGPLERPLCLAEGETLELGAGGLPLPERLIELLEPGMRLLLDDGAMLLEVTAPRRARVLRGGTLGSRKGLTVEGLEYEAPPLTPRDCENLRAARDFGVTAVMQSFTRSARGHRRRALRAGRRSGHPRLCQGREPGGRRSHAGAAAGLGHDSHRPRRPGRGLRHLRPAARKSASPPACRAAGAPFMVVTQLMYSMQQNPSPPGRGLRHL